MIYLVVTTSLLPSVVQLFCSLPLVSDKMTVARAPMSLQVFCYTYYFLKIIFCLLECYFVAVEVLHGLESTPLSQSLELRQCEISIKEQRGFKLRSKGAEGS